MLAVRGTQLGLIPHPAAELSRWVVLVEGPPDMISARSRGLPAIAVPGDDACEPEWAQSPRIHRVRIATRPGRDAAARIADDLKAAAVRGSVVDLAHDRHDGYDLTDWLDERFAVPRARARRARSTRHPPIAPGARRQPLTSGALCPPSPAPPTR